MSQFDKYTKPEYVEALRVFLHESKRDFLRKSGFEREPDAPPVGRLRRYKTEPILVLEQLVNEKAARSEAPDTTLDERFKLARDYTGLTDAQIAREMTVSRELVRRWGAGINAPTRLPELAQLLNAPLKWLEEGGEHNLPANSHIGVRVGAEALHWREQLYSLTVDVITEVPDHADESYTQAFIEWSVFNRPEMANVARRAGGRWQVINNTLLFSPWVPIAEHGLTRRFWSDEVEAIIQEELGTKPSVYAAWGALSERCKALGLADDEYPKRISLHKRVEKETARADQFGVDLNEVVAAAVAKNTMQ